MAFLVAQALPIAVLAVNCGQVAFLIEATNRSQLEAPLAIGTVKFSIEDRRPKIFFLIVKRFFSDEWFEELHFAKTRN